MKGVSVIICCYNSSQRLPETIQHLLAQQVKDGINWEIIFVNNASTDNTVSLVEEYTVLNPHLDISIADQPVAGLSYARLKGIEVAKYEFLLFCDDDNWLAPDYVDIAFNIMSSSNSIGALGGHGKPVCATKPPKWFSKYASIYAVGEQGIGEQKLPMTQTLYGAACVYRKSVLTELLESGFQFRLTGRFQNTLSTGEDRELCYAISLNGYSLWYSNRLKFSHYIPEERLTSSYRLKLLEGARNVNHVFTAYQLLISSKSQHRPDYKNSWEWLLINLIALSMKRAVKDFFKLKLKGEKLSGDLKDIVQFYRNRKSFSAVLADIKTYPFANFSINKTTN